MSSETSRIIAMPARDPFPEDAVSRLTLALKTERGTMTLWPMQAEVLLEAVRQRRESPELGVFVRGGLGTGKTLPGLLLPTVIQGQPGKRALYLCPANLRDKTLKELPEYRRHWRIRQDLLIHSYEELSADPELLTKLRVYLVICDEGHALKNLGSNRTRRALRVARQDPSIVWVVMSATSSTKGLKDHGHLFELALRSGSPLPRSDQELSSWAACVDSVCSAEASDWGMIRPLVESIMNGRAQEAWDGPAAGRILACRQSLNTRVSTTRGVVTGDRVDVEAKLVLRRVTFDCPKEIKDALAELESSGTLPGSGGAAILSDQKEVDGRGQMSIAESQLCMGGYYRWCWERTSHGKPDERWLACRREWSSALSEYLTPGGQGERDGVDGMRQVVLRMDSMPSSVRRAWRDWEPERDRYRVQYLGERASGVGEPIPVESVWLTEEVLERMCDRLRKKGCLLWYKHKFVAHALRQRGFRVVLAGEDFPWSEVQGDGKSVALSEFSHSQGHNLQAWHRTVVPCPGASRNSPGAQLDQMIGRCHRVGQYSAEVVVDLWQHAEPVKRWLRTAVQEARYMEDSGGLPQRLNLGHWEDVSL